MLDIANTRWRFDQQTNAGPPCRGASFGAAGGGVSHGMSGPHTVSGGDTVDLPGLWTPAQRRVESDRRRSGRPQPLGNLADDRCRLSLRFRPRDSHSPTAHRRHGHRSSEHDPCTARGSCAGQRGLDDHEGMTTHPEYTLAKPSDLSEQPGPLHTVRGQTPATMATRLTGSWSSSTRATSSARLAGVVLAFWWMPTRSSGMKPMAVLTTSFARRGRVDNVLRGHS